jgi:hypothetical protein
MPEANVSGVGLLAFTEQSCQEFRKLGADKRAGGEPEASHQGEGFAGRTRTLLRLQCASGAPAA